MTIVVRFNAAGTVTPTKKGRAPGPHMTESLHAARSRQLARLPDGRKPPAPRAALAIAKSRAYQAAADAPATLMRPISPISRRGARRMVSSPCPPPRKPSVPICPRPASATRRRRCDPESLRLAWVSWRHDCLDRLSSARGEDRGTGGDDVRRRGARNTAGGLLVPGGAGMQEVSHVFLECWFGMPAPLLVHLSRL